MKKQYINPSMEVVKIETQGILAMSKVGEITEPLSRRGRFDEDDEE
ncbi:MAG: hypothetical protein K6G46_11870 [Prevotella sp.]|nr:hypothetical protein [Prevotella sp.]